MFCAAIEFPGLCKLPNACSTQKVQEQAHSERERDGNARTYANSVLYIYIEKMKSEPPSQFSAQRAVLAAVLVSFLIETLE
jgi:hypothetical protein